MWIVVHSVCFYVNVGFMLGLELTLGWSDGLLLGCKDGSLLVLG